jgi:murein DD-endopeptidase MepM/ murein hydrolase activator NlpD
VRDKLTNRRRWHGDVLTHRRRLARQVRSAWHRLGQAPILVRLRQVLAAWAGPQRPQEMVVALVALTAIGLGTATATTVDARGPSARPGPHATASADLSGRDAALDRSDRSARTDPLVDGSAPENDPGSGSTPPDASPSAAPDTSERSEPAAAAPAPPPKWVHPMPGAFTTSCFGPRWGVLLGGVDLASPPGTPIRAVGAGTVIHAGWGIAGYGISVMIDHGDGYVTHYAHASQATVSVGDRVEPGDVIALEGSTGDSSGPHLHFEVHKGMWNRVEPVRWLANRNIHIDGC